MPSRLAVPMYSMSTYKPDPQDWTFESNLHIAQAVGAVDYDFLFPVAKCQPLDNRKEIWCIDLRTTGMMTQNTLWGVVATAGARLTHSSLWAVMALRASPRAAWAGRAWHDSKRIAARSDRLVRSYQNKS